MPLVFIILGTDGQPFVRLPLEVQDKIANMVHREEHKDCMAKVLNRMADLPKCETCGSVSILVVSLFSLLPHRNPFSFLFFDSTNITFPTSTCGPGGVTSLISDGFVASS